MQVAILTVIGKEAREVYSTFNDSENDGDAKKIKPVLKKFGEYCEQRKIILFERFNRGNVPHSATIVADNCNFEEITLKYCAID